MRHITDVIKQLQEIVPVEQEELHRVMNSVYQSASFSPPELMYLRWGRLAEIFETELKMPAPLTAEWQVKAVAVLMDKSEHQISEEFAIDSSALDRERENKPILGAPRTWYDFGEVLDVLKERLARRWMWYRNTRCKYVELRIDMRDGKCLIRDKDGNSIELDQLKFQYGEPPKES
jgi:hypothetical protein